MYTEWRAVPRGVEAAADDEGRATSVAPTKRADHLHSALGRFLPVAQGDALEVSHWFGSSSSATAAAVQQCCSCKVRCMLLSLN